jgi:hypothetical protein
MHHPDRIAFPTDNPRDRSAKATLACDNHDLAVAVLAALLPAKVRRGCLGLTRFGGHPESLAGGAADAKNTSAGHSASRAHYARGRARAIAGS